MKLSKKFITAIGMLTLSAVMLTTSSFAWFSMNDKVSATGMSVTAQADQVFLQISNSQTFAEGNESNKYLTEASATNPSAKLAAVAVEKTSTWRWFKNYSNKPTESTGVVSGGIEITTGLDHDENGALKGYCLINTFYLGLNAELYGAATAGAPLNSIGVSLTGDTSDPIANAVSVLVVCGDNAQLWKQDASGKFDKDASGDAALTDNNFNGSTTTPTAVKVFVFFDGENANCKTSEVEKEHSYTVSVNFSVAA